MSELEKGSWNVEKVLTLINAQEVKNQQDMVVGFGNKEEGNIWIVVLFVYNNTIILDYHYCRDGFRARAVFKIEIVQGEDIARQEKWIR